MRRYRRPGTRFSEDGCTAFVRLRVTRRSYEFARAWAMFHAAADPGGTAEDHLEGYLATALAGHIEALDWTAPPEIEALYPKVRESSRTRSGSVDDGIPF